MKRAVCKHCGAGYTGTRDQRFCSPRCGLLGRGPEWFKAAQARMVAGRKANGYTRRIRRLRAAGLTDAQIAVVRFEILRVMKTSHEAGKRLGIRQGWADALGEHDDMEARPPVQERLA